MSTLTQRELATLSDADRAMWDDALQQIPPEHNALFTALLLSTRAVVRHDIAGIRTATAGYAELLDVADERARELVEAARELRDTAAAYEERFTALEQRMAESGADRRRLHGQLHTQRRWIVALTVAVAAGLPMIAVVFARVVYVVLWGAS